ncbi:hypothetical protein ND00_31370 [Clostridium sp. L74]|nr:hypothetical protein ND00_31370 [Clostridium sp. L74]
MKMNCINNCKHSIDLPNPITQVASMPYALYLSLQGKYFVGYADELEFGNGRSAWAGLINPCGSGVNLHVYVWTVTNIGTSPIRAQIWFNSDPPGQATISQLVTPANTALCPLPQPRIKLVEASNVRGEPEGGVKAFVRRVLPEVTIADEEVGKFIFPPGGSFIIFLSNPEAPNEPAQGRVAFGWWEEKIK